MSGGSKAAWGVLRYIDAAWWMPESTMLGYADEEQRILAAHTNQERG